MTRQPQPVNKWLRRLVLVALAGSFLSGILRLPGGSAFERAATVLVVVSCVPLFVHWWRMPSIPGSQEDGQQ